LPEISRFFGIIVRMYAEPGAPHHRPHFHVYYQNHSAVYGIDVIEMLNGTLPRRQQRLVEAWANFIKVNCLRTGSDCKMDNFLTKLPH